MAAAPNSATLDEELANPDPAGDELVEEDYLVEEISIDGMCGVY